MIGLDYRDAIAQLNLLGLTVRSVSSAFTEGVNVGEAYWQPPAAFEVVPEGSQIDIKIGGSPATPTAPLPASGG